MEATSGSLLSEAASFENLFKVSNEFERNSARTLGDGNFKNLVQVHKETRLELSTGQPAKWWVESKPGAGDRVGLSDGKAVAYVEHTFTEFGKFAVYCQVMELDESLGAVHTFEVSAKVIRFEIRDLSEDDRVAYFDALHTFYMIGQVGSGMPRHPFCLRCAVPPEPFQAWKCCRPAHPFPASGARPPTPVRPPWHVLKPRADSGRARVCVQPNAPPLPPAPPRVPVQSEGEKLYGSNYKSLSYLVREHLYGAADKACDHWHDDAGILTHHIGITWEMEQSLRTIDPTTAAHYWDYTREEKLGIAWHNSPVFGEDWFGSNSPANKDHIVDSGRWAYTPVKKGRRMAYVCVCRPLPPWTPAATNKPLSLRGSTRFLLLCFLPPAPAHARAPPSLLLR